MTVRWAGWVLRYVVVVVLASCTDNQHWAGGRHQVGSTATTARYPQVPVSTEPDSEPATATLPPSNTSLSLSWRGGLCAPHLACCSSFMQENLTRDLGEEKCDEVPCDVRRGDLSVSVTPNLSPVYIWPVDDL